MTRKSGKYKTFVTSKRDFIAIKSHMYLNLSLPGMYMYIQGGPKTGLFLEVCNFRMLT